MQKTVDSGHVETNGLRMYYEVHGEGSPLVLIHGALSATQSSFGRYIPDLAERHKVVALEMQAHGHTADVDRPLRVRTMADDTIGAIRELGIDKADLLGYSMGGGIALDVAIRHPELVRKLVVLSAGYDNSSFHPGLLEGMSQLRPEHLAGSPWQLEYAQVAPRQEDWPVLVEKVKDMNANLPQWSEAEMQSIQVPTLIVTGDSDVVLEHTVKMFRLLGGGIFGDTPAGLAKSQLAVLPGTAHTMMVDRAQILLPMLEAFLDQP